MATFTIFGSTQRTTYYVSADLADMPVMEKSLSVRFRPERVTVRYESTVDEWDVSGVSLIGPRVLADGTERDEVRDDLRADDVPAWLAPIVEALAPIEEPYLLPTNMSASGEITPPVPVAPERAGAEIVGFDPKPGEVVWMLTSRNYGSTRYVDEAPSRLTVERVTKTLVITSDGRRWKRGSGSGRDLRLAKTYVVLDSGRRLVPDGSDSISEETRIWQDQGSRAR